MQGESRKEVLHANGSIQSATIYLLMIGAWNLRILVQAIAFALVSREGNEKILNGHCVNNQIPMERQCKREPKEMAMRSCFPAEKT